MAILRMEDLIAASAHTGDVSKEAKEELHRMIDALFPMPCKEARANRIVSRVYTLMTGARVAEDAEEPSGELIAKLAKITEAKLTKMDEQALRALARDLGLSTKGKFSQERYINRILDMKRTMESAQQEQ